MYFLNDVVSGLLASTIWSYHFSNSLSSVNVIIQLLHCTPRTSSLIMSLKHQYCSHSSINSKHSHISNLSFITTHSLTHCCTWPARAIATTTTSDPAPMTTASRLCTRDHLPPVVSMSSLADQVDASSRGQSKLLKCNVTEAAGMTAILMLKCSGAGSNIYCLSHYNGMPQYGLTPRLDTL